jgi:mannose-6-phosphate isomerase
MRLYPLIFHPIYKQRVWGGRKLEELYAKPLPPGVPIGESWEISDRPGDVSVIANGALASKDLHWLIQEQWDQLGGTTPKPERFPLLIKILDAREKLSLQVHPPAGIAAQLGGEPKTEMWYIADASPGAELYVGLKNGVTREEFETGIENATVGDCFHRVPVASGDAMFLPSGRIHAIGAGLVIFEIQQNSDTTYRLYDWGRVGLDGRPRELHHRESLASINFDDFEPDLISAVTEKCDGGEVQQLASNELFKVRLCRLKPGARRLLEPGMRIIAVVSGDVRFEAQGLLLASGQFCLIPAALKEVVLSCESATAFLEIKPG